MSEENPLTFHDRASLVIEAFDPIEAHTAELEQRIERELVWAHNKGQLEAAPELAKAVARIEELEGQLAGAIADPAFVKWRAYFEVIAPETSAAPIDEETGRFAPPPGTAPAFVKELAQILLGVAQLDAALVITASPDRGFEIASLVLEESTQQRALHGLFEVMGAAVEQMINRAVAMAADPEAHHPRCPANPNAPSPGPCLCRRGPAVGP